MIIYGIWTPTGSPIKFPIPFKKGFTIDPSVSDYPLIVGATPYGNNELGVSIKIYIPNTNLSQIDFVQSSRATIAYTAIGYWK